MVTPGTTAPLGSVTRPVRLAFCTCDHAGTASPRLSSSHKGNIFRALWRSPCKFLIGNLLFCKTLSCLTVSTRRRSGLRGYDPQVTGRLNPYQNFTCEVIRVSSAE